MSNQHSRNPLLLPSSHLCSATKGALCPGFGCSGVWSQFLVGSDWGRPFLPNALCWNRNRITGWFVLKGPSQPSMGRETFHLTGLFQPGLDPSTPWPRRVCCGVWWRNLTFGFVTSTRCWLLNSWWVLRSVQALHDLSGFGQVLQEPRGKTRKTLPGWSSKINTAEILGLQARWSVPQKTILEGITVLLFFH